MAKSARPVRFRDKWRVRWIDHDGRRCSAVFESYEEADRELRRKQTETDDILRGLREAEPADRTFEALAEWWRNNRATKRSKADDESMLRKHLQPAFGALPLRAIRGEVIEAYKAERTRLSPKTVANHLTLLGTMLRAAVENGWLLSMPIVVSREMPPQESRALS